MAEDLNQLGNLLALFGGIAADDRLLHAMGEMIGENDLLHLGQGGAGGADLGHDVEAVAILLHHLRDTAHLAFNPGEPFGNRDLR